MKKDVDVKFNAQPITFMDCLCLIFIIFSFGKTYHKLLNLLSLSPLHEIMHRIFRLSALMERKVNKNF